MSFVGLDEGVSSNIASGSRERSSHLPRTRSKLFPTRWTDVHLLGVTDSVEEPVVLVKRLIFDWELLRDNGPAPLREDVRSNSRVWYAKGAEEPDLEPDEALDDTEFERSIRNYDMLERRVIERSVDQYST